MPSNLHLGKVTVLTETSQTLFLSTHSVTKETKFYSHGASDTCDSVSHWYLQSNQGTFVPGSLYPLCDESGRVLYHCSNAGLNFNSGSVVVVRYQAAKWEMGYLDQESELVLFKFTAVMTEIDPTTLGLCNNENGYNENNNNNDNGYNDANTPWFRRRWFWVIGAILLIILIAMVIAALVRKKKSSKATCSVSQSKPVCLTTTTLCPPGGEWKKERN